MTSINLLDLANQLATRAKSLHQKVETTGQPVLVSAGLLSKKVAALKKLPSELALFRVRKRADGFYVCDTINIFCSDDCEAVVYTPDLEPAKDFEFIRYKSGIDGWCDIKHKSGLELRVSISASYEHILELSAQDSNGIEGEGQPLPNYLRLVPQPGIPLYSDALPQNTDLEILTDSNRKKVREYQSPMVTIKTSSGEVIKNVICTPSLERIFRNYGAGAKFRIVGKCLRKNSEGQPSDSEGKVNYDKPAWIVQVVDCQTPNFDYG